MNKDLPVEVSDNLKKLETADGVEKIDLLNSLALYYVDKNLSLANTHVGAAAELARKLKEDVRLALSLLIQGRILYNSNDIIAGLEMFSLAAVIFEKNGDIKNAIDCLLRIGRCQDFLGDSSRALETHFKALKYAQNLKDSNLEAWAYMELGLSCWANKDSNLALEYMNKSYDLRKAANQKANLAVITGNIGNVYVGMNDYNTAYKYFKDCLTIFEDIKNPDGIARAHISMGIALWGLGKFDEALEFVKKNFRIFIELDNKEAITEVYSLLGSIYTGKEEFNTAQDYFDKALETADKYNLNYKLENLYEGKYQCAEKSGDYKTAFEYFTKHHELAGRRLREASEVKTKYLGSMHEVDMLKKESESFAERNLELNELNHQLSLKNNNLSDTLNTLHAQSVEIERINKINTRILSILAHDLKNPLGVIQQVAEMYGSKTLDHDVIEEIFQELEKNSSAALNMLNEVLQWGTTQMEKKKTADISDINIYDLIQKKEHDYRQLLKSKNNTLINNCDKDFIIQADINMLRFIIRNLIVNANKFTKNGTISVTVNDLNESVEIIVSDTGIGMKQSQINRLFQWETRQSSEGTSGEKGTGLGLLICNEFVINHKGKIWAESEQGKGSSFHFTISKNLK